MPSRRTDAGTWPTVASSSPCSALRLRDERPHRPAGESPGLSDAETVSDAENPHSNKLLRIQLHFTMRHARRGRLFSALMCATAAGLAPAHVASSQQSRRAALGSLTGLCAIAVAPSPSAAKLDAASARSQLEASETAVDDLLQRFDAITAAEGGDGVRRVLGTVGVKSPLFRVEIAAKLLARESEEDPEAQRRTPPMTAARGCRSVCCWGLGVENQNLC